MNTVSNLSTLPEQLAVDEGAYLNTVSNLKTLPEQVAVDEGAYLNRVSNLKTLPKQVAVREGAYLKTVLNLKTLPEQLAVRALFSPIRAIFSCFAHLWPIWAIGHTLEPARLLIGAKKQPRCSHFIHYTSISPNSSAWTPFGPPISKHFAPYTTIIAPFHLIPLLLSPVTPLPPQLHPICTPYDSHNHRLIPAAMARRR